MKRILILLGLAPYYLDAQVTVQNNQSVEYYIQNVLLGSGVTVSNVTINGQSGSTVFNQVGAFVTSNNFLELSDGLILGSGDVKFAENGSNSGGGEGQGNDPDLANLITSSIFDKCVIEFDFVPTGDKIEFSYIFSSVEYPTYVCSDFNDVFGFFLTGPSPGGGSYSSKNLALVPDPNDPSMLTFTTTPVAINTINSGTPGGAGDINTCLQADPNFASYSIYFQPTPAWSYGGRTTKLPVRANVICGETYHIKIAICDAGDDGLDSGVFLEGGSFTSNGISVTPYSAFADQNMVEGCRNFINGSDGIFVVNSSDPDNIDTLIYALTGSSILNQDYSISNLDTLILGAGIGTDTIYVYTNYSDTLNDTDTLTLSILNTDGCAEASFYVVDYIPFQGHLRFDSLNICPPEKAELNLMYTGGQEPIQIEWSNGAGNEALVYVSPSHTTFYSVTWEDACNHRYELYQTEVWVQCPVEETNIFTPNGDAFNKYFVLQNLDDYPEPQLTIYNRWGKVVYQSENYQHNWDGTHYMSGKELDEGIYYYVVSPNSPKYDYIENKNEDLKKTLTGFVHLIR